MNNIPCDQRDIGWDRLPKHGVNDKILRSWFALGSTAVGFVVDIGAEDIVQQFEVMLGPREPSRGATDCRHIAVQLPR